MRSSIDSSSIDDRSLAASAHRPAMLLRQQILPPRRTELSTKNIILVRWPVVVQSRSIGGFREHPVETQLVVQNACKLALSGRLWPPLRQILSRFIRHPLRQLGGRPVDYWIIA